MAHRGNLTMVTALIIIHRTIIMAMASQMGLSGDDQAAPHRRPTCAPFQSQGNPFGHCLCADCIRRPGNCGSFRVHRAAKVRPPRLQEVQTVCTGPPPYCPHLDLNIISLSWAQGSERYYDLKRILRGMRRQGHSFGGFFEWKAMGNELAHVELAGKK